MSKQDSLRTQNCVLKVNIDCNGCAQKVKKRLKKIQGVYSVNIDADQGKVVVTGNVDPAKLIKKLKSSGMHAELLLSGEQKGVKNLYNQTHPINNQFQNFQIDNNNNNYSEGGKHNKSKQGEGGGQVQSHSKVVHDFKAPQKSVKFHLPEDKSDDDGHDDLEDYYDDEEEGYGHDHGHAMPTMMRNGAGPLGPVGMMNGPNHKGNNGNGKEGNVIDPTMLIKGKGGNRNHNNANKVDKGEKQNSEGQRVYNENKSEKYAVGSEGDGIKKKNAKSGGGGLLGRFLRFGKKSKKRDQLVAVDDTYKNRNNYKEIKEEKEGDGKLQGGSKSKSKGDFDFHGKNGKGNNGNGNMGHMGPMDIQAVQGQYHQTGMQMQMQPPPYNQHQQYMAMMMNQQQHQQQQQQEAYMNNMYPQAMMYGRQHPSMNYMPPPPPMPVHPMNDPITHTFSDENIESCTIM